MFPVNEMCCNINIKFKEKTKQPKKPCVQFLHLWWVFLSLFFCCLHPYHKRIPELLIRNGLPSHWCSSTANPQFPCCSSRATLSYNHPTGDRERRSEGHSQQYQSHQKQQAHKIIRELNNVSAKSIEESISHSFIVWPLRPHSWAYRGENIPWWFAHIY